MIDKHLAEETAKHTPLIEARRGVLNV